MSPPIRDGSGNSIGSIRLGDGSEIAEVRTGAGDVLFSGVSIPDSAVNQWKLDEESGTSVSDSIGSNSGVLEDANWVSDSNTVGDYWVDFNSNHLDVSRPSVMNQPLSNTSWSVGLTAQDLDSFGGGAADSRFIFNMNIDNAGILSLASTRNSDDDLIFGEKQNTLVKIRNSDLPSSGKARVCVINNNGTLDIYVNNDNNNVVSADDSAIDEAGDDKLRFGRLSDRTNDSFNYPNNLDNIIVYNKALTSSEVSSDYNIQPWS